MIDSVMFICYCDVNTELWVYLLRLAKIRKCH